MRFLTRLPLSLAVLAAVALVCVFAAGDSAAAQRKDDPPIGGESASAGDTVSLPMLKRPIARDDIISADDIVWVDTNARRLPNTALLEEDELIGMVARRHLQAGRAILARDITRPLAVKKGDLVAIVYTTPFMTLTARGRALEDAPAGAPVRILNAHSNRTVEATAIAPGIVATRPLTHAELAEAIR
jgi:flagellar basal body P-ring formation protein FlgA